MIEHLHDGINHVHNREEITIPTEDEVSRVYPVRAYFWAVYGVLSSAFFINGTHHILDESRTEGIAEILCGIGTVLLARHMFLKAVHEHAKQNEDHS